jgi:hypothetical protein
VTTSSNSVLYFSKSENWRAVSSQINQLPEPPILHLRERMRSLCSSDMEGNSKYFFIFADFVVPESVVGEVVLRVK